MGAKRLTQEEFIKRAKEIHCKNNEYFLLEIPYFKIKELNKILEEQVGTNNK